MTEIKYFSTFSGIGGFEEAIHRVCPDAKQIGYSEINKYANMVLKYHYPEVKNYGDITKINAKELKGCQLLVGGFPCQAFSIAGNRMGFEDIRGTLFFNIANIAKNVRPKVLLLENVKGLLNHEKGATFATIIKTLGKLGYDAEWEVLNSKHFGVPQNRERTFIVAYLGGGSGRKVFPLRGTSQEVDGASKLEEFTPKGTSQWDRIYKEEGLSPTLTRSGAERGLYKIGNVNPSKKGMGGEVHDSKGLSPTITTNKGEGKKIAIPIITPDRINKRQRGRRIKENDDPSFTLTAQDKHGVIVQEKRIRRLTPRECERLQGFPDDWTKFGRTEGGEIVKISDSQRYKMLGNAVTVNVVEAILRKLMRNEFKNDEKKDY